MISVLALKTAQALKKRSPNNPIPIEKLQFILHIIFNVVFTAAGALIISAFLGHFMETALILVASYILRRFAGGYHMSESWQCIGLTMLLSNAIPYISFNIMWVVLLNITSLILIFIYAPSRIEHDTNIPKDRYKVLKIKSAGVVAVNFLLLTPPLSIVFVLQGISLIRREVI